MINLRRGGDVMPDALLSSRYRIAQRLEGDGACAVYRAVDLRTGVDVVLTLPQNAPLRDPDFLREFRRAALQATRLHSAHIARVLEVAHHAGMPYLVSEFVAGETLADRLARDGAPARDEALRVALAVASALVTAHRQGIAHGALSPRRIRIAAGAVKVLGFGRTRLGSQHSVAWPAADHAPYLAPEQADGAGTQAADVYAFGVLVYRLLADRLPFDGAGSNSAGAMLVRLPPTAPGGVAAMVGRALAHRPEDRGTAAALAWTLERVLHAPNRAVGGARTADGPLVRRAETSTLPRGVDVAFPPTLPASRPTVVLPNVAGDVGNHMGRLPLPSPDLHRRETGHVARSHRARRSGSMLAAGAVTVAAMAVLGGVLLLRGRAPAITPVAVEERAPADASAENPPPAAAVPAPPAATATPITAVLRPGDQAPLIFQISIAGQWRLAVIDGAGARARVLPPHGDWDEGEPHWSPDGSRIAFVSNGDGRFHIYVMRADGSDVRQLTRGAFDDRDPAWSPDGASIAFASNRDGGQSQIFVVPAAGGEPRQLSSGPGGGTQPAWSPDGARIAFARRPGAVATTVVGADGSRVTFVREPPADAAPQIFEIEARGGEPRQITDGPGRHGDPAWSPDGAAIAYSVAGDGAADIFVTDISGTAMRRLTTGDDNRQPAWSPDGKHIVFSSTRGGGTDLSVVGLESGRVRQLATGLTASIQPSWPRR